jgi:hypothetical protein
MEQWKVCTVDNSDHRFASFDVEQDRDPHMVTLQKYGSQSGDETGKKIPNRIGLTQYYWASTRVPDPDPALSVIGFQDANKNKFFALLLSDFLRYIYISLQRFQVINSHKI